MKNNRLFRTLALAVILWRATATPRPWAQPPIRVESSQHEAQFRDHILFQLVAEALSLSNPLCEVFTRHHDTDQAVYPLHDLLPPHSTNIIATLSHFGDDDYTKPFMFRNQMNDWGKGLSSAVQRRVKSYRKYHLRSIYAVEEIPQCRHCHETSQSCSYWRICCQYGAVYPRTYQTYWGKRKLLVKTKPHAPRLEVT